MNPAPRLVLSCALLATVALATAQDHVMYFGYDYASQSFPSRNHEYKLAIGFKKSTLILRHGKQELWQIKWPQGALPAQAFIADDGSRVVLLDTQPGPGDMIPLEDGNGLKLVVLDDKGKVLKAYRADDLYLGDKYSADPSGAYTYHSSIGCPSQAFRFDPKTKEFTFLQVALEPGTEPEDNAGQFIPVSIDLVNGEQVKANEQIGKSLTQNVLQHPSDDIICSENKELSLACMKASAGDQSVIPLLKKYLNDPTANGTEMRGKKYFSLHDNQNRAAIALAKLMGKDAAPLIEARLLKADSNYDQERFLIAMKVAGVVPSPPTIERIESRNDPHVQLTLLDTLEKIDQSVALREARKLIHYGTDYSTDYVRGRAQSLILENPQSVDEPYLKDLLETDALDRDLGLRGLVRLNPPDLDQILAQQAAKGNWVAVAYQAERGDVKAQTQIVDWTNAIANSQKVENIKRVVPEDLYMIAPILAKTNPPGAREALKKASALLGGQDPLGMDMKVRGSLAQLGETSDLEFLRTVARGKQAKESSYGGALLDMRRSDAIDWLGEIKDQGSVDLLQDLSVDPHYGIRQSARRALGKMGITPNTEPHLALLTTQRVVDPQPVKSMPKASYTPSSNPSPTVIAAMAIGALVAIGGLYFSRRRK